VAVLRSSSALTLLLVACTRPAQGPLPGDSDASYKPSASAPQTEPSRKTPWADYAAARSSPAVTRSPFTSAGHPLAGSVEVHVSSESRDAYLGLVPDTVFPDGALLAELCAKPGSGPSYAMRKTGGSWAFYMLDEQGALVASGQLPFCAGCHQQAPADGVFGLPRDLSPTH